MRLQKRQQQGHEEAPPQQRAESTHPQEAAEAWTRECTGRGQGREWAGPQGRGWGWAAAASPTE